MSIDLISTTTTIEDLKELEASEAQNESNPTALSLADIHVADQVFQPRQVQYNALPSREHIKDLKSALKTQGKPLEPVIVAPVGSKFFLIDGHHRLSAYQAAGWSKKVPVTVIRVSLEEAIRRAIELNSKNKLPMTHMDKTEAAWKLTKAGGLSKAEITAITGVTSNVGIMRKVLRELKEKGIDVTDLTWARARKKHKGLPDDDFDREAWVNEKAEALRDKLLKAAPAKLINNPEVLAEAIRMISGKLPMALIDQWHEEAYDYVEEHREAIEEERRIAEELDI